MELFIPEIQLSSSSFQMNHSESKFEGFSCIFFNEAQMKASERSNISTSALVFIAYLIHIYKLVIERGNVSLMAYIRNHIS